MVLHRDERTESTVLALHGLFARESLLPLRTKRFTVLGVTFTVVDGLARLMRAGQLGGEG